MSDDRCPVGGCTRKVAFMRCLCRQHWSLLSHEQRWRLFDAWRAAYTSHDPEVVQTYWTARREAVAVVDALVAPGLRRKVGGRR